MRTSSTPLRTPKPSRRRFLESAGLATGGILTHAAMPSRTAAAQPASNTSPSARFRRLLERGTPSRCINCGDVATARLAEMHGFEVVMTGGSALSLSKYGIGDFGMITVDDQHRVLADGRAPCDHRFRRADTKHVRRVEYV